MTDEHFRQQVLDRLDGIQSILALHCLVLGFLFGRGLLDMFSGQATRPVPAVSAGSVKD